MYMYKSQCMINTFLQVQYVSVLFQKIDCFDHADKLIQEGEKATPPPFVSGRIKIGTGNPLYYELIELIFI